MAVGSTHRLALLVTHDVTGSGVHLANLVPAAAAAAAMHHAETQAFLAVFTRRRGEHADVGWSGGEMRKGSERRRKKRDKI